MYLLPPCGISDILLLSLTKKIAAIDLRKHLRLFVLFSGFVIEPVDPVVDKHKNVVKLLATAVSLSIACPSCPEGLELVPKGIVHKST